MNETTVGDKPESESLIPGSSLIEWREVREEARYRERCVETYDMVKLGAETFHPADILDKFSPDAARRGRADVYASFRSEVEEKVCDQFPSPIAVPFHSFLHGPREPLSRLHSLRDAWEGLIHLVCALSLAEAANSTAFVAGLKIRESETIAPRICKVSDLIGDKLATRIGITEALLNKFRDLKIAGELTEILPQGIITEIRRLNSVRNEFSHIGVLSEPQARAFIDEAYPSFLEILVDVVDLSNYELMRLRIIRPGTPSVADVEQLTGHALSRRVRSLALEPHTSNVILAAGRVGTLDRVLVKVGSRILDLSPFYYACDDQSGHRTRVVFFKSRKGDMWKFEIVGESSVIDEPSSPHNDQLNRFDTILGVRSF